jgi:hypothetical protein
MIGSWNTDCQRQLTCASAPEGGARCSTTCLKDSHGAKKKKCSHGSELRSRVVGERQRTGVICGGCSTAAVEWSRIKRDAADRFPTGDAGTRQGGSWLGECEQEGYWTFVCSRCDGSTESTSTQVQAALVKK